MSVHIEAKQGQIAETVLLPGDPLRAKFIADTLLTDVICYNTVRNMLGFTGYYKGKRVSIQGTGMGVPSIGIYATELMQDYGVQNLIRIGTCGAVHDDIKLMDVILAQAACTDSSINQLYFDGMDYAACADFDLLRKAYEVTLEKKMPVRVGSILTTDVFYVDDILKSYEKWIQHGVLAVEMETTALYTLAARYGRKALTILTVSDQIVRQERATSEERQTAFTDMIDIALSIV